MKSSFVLIVSLLISSFAFAGESEVQTVASVDLNKYVGKWYEVASIPQSFQKQCVGNTTAEYSLLENGQVKVLNTCDTKSGSRSVAEGRAKIEDNKSNAKLKVTFVKFLDWIFAFGGKYWILDLAEDYSYAVVGDPTRNYAWILSRVANPEISVLAKAEKSLKAQGYDTCKVLTSVQTGGFANRVPLCEAVKAAKDVVDVGVEAGNFKTFFAAVQMAGLEESLRSEGPFTLFLPTDAAFAKLTEQQVAAIFQDPAILAALLKNHIALGEYKTAKLVKVGKVENLNLNDLQINEVKNASKQSSLTVNQANIVKRDILAKNGVIQVVDSVLLPTLSSSNLPQ